MNQQKRKLIAWSPHNPSNFVVGANDLRLFEVKFKNGFKPSSTIKFSMDQARPEEDKKTISLLSINSEVQYLKCLAWSPSSYDPNMIAAGLANGRTVLTSFSSVNRITKEFVPRHSRSCNALAWNPFYKNQLACGLDKVRGDFSTIVWDVTLGSMGDPNVGGRVDNPHSISQREDNQFNLVPQEASSTVTEPMYELANSETTLALAWVPDSPSCLAAGTGVKWLRIYDLRGDVNAPRSVVAHAKAVSGVCFDNFDSNRLATFSEDGIVKIWDLRKLVDPTLTINTSSKAIQQIDWCPTRAGVLATIFKDGSSMKIWDVKEYSADSSRNGVLITKPSKTYHSSDVISSFAWHPSNECRMLIISPNTMAETVSLNETIPLSFSPQSDICFSYGTHFVTGPVASSSPSVVSSSSSSIANPADKNDFIDISVLMRHRALQGYSANIETNKNLSQLFNDKSLQFLWNWASTINTVTRPKKSDSSPPPQAHNSSHTVSAISNYTNTNTNTNTTNTNTNTNNTNNNNNNNSNNNNNNNNYTTRDFTGIYSVLFEGYVPPPPTIINWGVDPTGVSNSGTIMDKSGFFPVYKSSQRSTCLEICGWGFSSSHSLESILQKMEKEGEYERAAALAVFHLDVRRAVITLNRGSSSSALQDKEREFNLRLVAMALAGFSENQAASNHSFYNNSLWRETCGSMSSQYKHPYLSACFGFLCNDIPSVLDMSSIALKDRIAVACRYLNNEMLHNYIERIQQVSIEAGDLAGIIVTGLSPKGVDLFQRYIDRTGDVQSAGLAMGLVVPFVFKDARVLRWISSYRELLDNWQLWHERALLDIRRGSPDTAPRAQVYARCNFCNQSLSLGVLATTNRVAVRGNAPAVKHIVNSCPGCKKALPRCSLCMISLNCSLPSYDRRSSVILPPTPSMSNFPPPSPFANKTPVLTTSTSTPNLASSSVSAATSSSTSSSSSSIASPSPSLLQQSTTQSNNNKTPGTPSNPNSSSPTSIGVEGEYIGLWSTGSNSFDDWFSWCQTCRHGGHAKHLLEWFSVHTECPVTDCTCKCCSI